MAEGKEAKIEPRFLFFYWYTSTITSTSTSYTSTTTFTLTACTPAGSFAYAASIKTDNSVGSKLENYGKLSGKSDG